MMLKITEWAESIRDFLEMGGTVLTVIGLVAFLMWILIFERILFFAMVYRMREKRIVKSWFARKDRSSWNAHQIRDGLISKISLQVNQFIPLIKTLVALCPLLGLLGTVSGMIEVFDVMAFSGSGNPRSMASGVSKATIPTMAGMVGALSGVFATTWLTRAATRKVEHIGNTLTLEDKMIEEG